MEFPLVSIITPAYNHGAYIESCIKSVQQQSYTHWEMIILNDGSTDNTLQVAQRLAKEDPRIHVIHQENVGVFRLGETYNKGLQQASGKYIAVLEGDDLWEPGKLQSQVDILERDPSICITWGKATLINETDTKVYYISPEPGNIPSQLFNNDPPGTFIGLSLHGAWIPALTMLIPKKYLMEIGGFIQTHGMPLVDVPTILYLSTKGKFHFENKVLGKWRIYATQTTKKYTVEIYQGMFAFLKEFLPRIHTLSPEQKSKILSHYNLLCLVAYARSGRYKLIRKEYKSARKDYSKAIFFPVGGKWIWRLRSLVGYGMSLLHMDVEWMAGLMGKKTYKE